MTYIKDTLSEIDEVTIYASNLNDTSTISFSIDNLVPDDVGYMLENSFDVIVRSGLHCAPMIHQVLGSYPHGSVRVSPSYFTTEFEIEQFIKAIKQIVRAGVLV